MLMTSNLKWNIVLVGENGVGKTAMCNRFVKNSFSKIYSPTTITERFTKNIEIDNYNIEIHIWSTSGNECFKSFLPEYFQLAQGCVLVYDMTKIASFYQLSGWLTEFRTFNETAPVIIAGNKSEDLILKPENLILEFDIEDLKVMECSAKNGENVNKVFQCLIEKIWENTHLKKHKDNNSSNHAKFVKPDKKLVTLSNKNVLEKSGELKTPIRITEDNISINQKTGEINSYEFKKCNESKNSNMLIDKSSINQASKTDFFISGKSDKFMIEEDNSEHSDNKLMIYKNILKKSAESILITVLNLYESFSYRNLGIHIEPELFFVFIFCATLFSLYLIALFMNFF